jgi:hypothetical protein
LQGLPVPECGTSLEDYVRMRLSGQMRSWGGPNFARRHCMFARSPSGNGATSPFTGEMVNNSNLIFTLGTPGIAAATLDLTQNPPHMKNFTFQETVSTDTVITAVGTLTQQPPPAPNSLKKSTGTVKKAVLKRK